MHRILHGIRRSVLEAWGLPCLPILSLLFDGGQHEAEEEEEPLYQREEIRGDKAAQILDLQALNHGQTEDEEETQQANIDLADADRDLHAHCVGQNEKQNGSLLPARGDEEDTAVNADLQNSQGEEMGRLLPVSGEINGLLLLNKRGDDEDNHAAKMDLQPPFQGGQHEEEAQIDLPQPVAPTYEENQELSEANIDLLKFLHTLPIDGRQDEDGMTSPPFQQQSEVIGVLLPRLGVAIATERKDMKSWYVYAINSWLMPSTRPRVKMKEEILLFFLSTGMLDPGIQGTPIDAHACSHDAWVSSSSTSTSFINVSRGHSSSPMAISLNISLSNATHADKPQTISLPFTPLRGRKGYQAREMQDEKKMKTRMQTKLIYLMKDVLDPG